MHQDATWYGGRPQPRRLCVRWGSTFPSPKGAQSSPIFGQCPLWPNDWMHQGATWYGGRSQPRRLCVRWGRSPLPQKGEASPNFRIFGPRLLWPNSCMDELDASWCGSRPRPRPHCTRRGPSSRERGTATSFRPMSIAATVAHLSYC